MKFNHILAVLLAIVSFLAASTSGLAASPAGAPMPADGTKTEMTATKSTLPTTLAEIRKIDVDNKKITLKHGEIKNLDMPGMTMVFQVKDAAMLESLKPGDKVMFTADKVDGAFTVLSIEKMK
jgi:Cu(I)/Ag(I) efflux system periplasmic protein CusF